MAAGKMVLAYKAKPKRKYTRKAPKVSKAVKQYVKSRIEAAPEKQNKNGAITKEELYHNVFYTPKDLFQSAFMPAQNDNEDGFVGQKYRMLGYKIRLLCGQKNDRPNVTWRVSFIQVRSSTVKNYSNMFNNVTGNVLLDDISDKYCRKLKEFWWKPNKGSMNNVTDEFTFVKKLYLPFKRVINTDGVSGYPRNHDPVLMMIHVYDAYGSLITDNIAYYQGWVEAIYKDI